jgi:predicted enzyme related to lactoylglutathione lyase
VQILGFKRDFGDGSDGWSFLSRDCTRVMLGECVGETPAGELGNHSWYGYFNVDDAQALYEEIIGKGGEPWSKPVDKPWGLREFGITTPDGHRIVFGQDLRS